MSSILKPLRLVLCHWCMRHACFILGSLILAILWGCSQWISAPAPAPTSTPQSVSDPTNTDSVSVTQSNPITPTPVLYSDDEIRELCFYMDSRVPNSLLEPLHEIVYEHTTKGVPIGEGRFRVVRGYFVDPRLGAVDDSHRPVPTPETWSAGLGNHAFVHYGHIHGYLNSDTTFQITPNRISPGSDHWEMTLYGAMNVEFSRGGGIWELRADATLDPDTCEATLEKVVAGPDEIVLYPDDDS